VKVRFFHEMHRARPQDQMPDEVRSPHRVLPKKTSWEEALARFETISPPPVPADPEISDGPDETSSAAHR
jgi:hypothetical protein